MMVSSGDELRVGCEVNAGARRLRIDVEHGWFQLDDRPAVALERRWLLRRLLVALARARLATPDRPLATPALVAAGWPGERILPRAARNRLHVALHRLRRLGLRDALRCTAGGWLLARDLAVELREPGPAVAAPGIEVSAADAWSW